MAFVYLGELISNTAVHQRTKIVAVHSITLSKHLPMFRLNPSDIEIFFYRHCTCVSDAHLSHLVGIAKAMGHSCLLLSCGGVLGVH